MIEQRKKIIPISFNSIGLTTKGRRAHFNYDSGAFDTPRHSPVQLERIGRFPAHVRMQPEGKVFPLNMIITSPDSETQFEAISKIFDPSNGLQLLRVDDCDGRRKRLECVPQQIVVEQNNEKPLVVPLWAPEPLFEA